MLSTSISFELNSPVKHLVNLNYSKWDGSLSVLIDEKVIKKTRIAFGGDEREYNIPLDKDGVSNLLIEVYPGKAFWVKPVIKMSVDGELIKVYKGNSETHLDLLKNFVSEYKSAPPFEEGFKYLTILCYLVMAIFGLAGIAIVPVTAILHPNELRTNIFEIGMGILMAFILATVFFYLAKLFKSIKLKGHEVE